MDKLNQFFNPFWIFLHNGHIVRRAVLFVAVWMTVDSYEWAKAYGSTADANEWLVVAVMGVPSALMAAAIKFYNTGRNNE